MITKNEENEVNEKLAKEENNKTYISDDGYFIFKLNTVKYIKKVRYINGTLTVPDITIRKRKIKGELKGSIIVFKDGIFSLKNSLNNILFLSILLSVMYYFFFTFKRQSKLLNYTAQYGRFFMMICFGAFFGSTVMARMALLVERFQFLINTWVPTLMSLWR